MGLSERNRRIARLSVGVVLVPLMCFTTAMFFATGGPVPKAFSSWHDLGFLPRGRSEDKPVRQFEGVTECGRAYVVRDRENSLSSSSTDKATLYDLWTNEKLGEVQIANDTRPGVLSQDKKRFFGLTRSELDSGPFLGLRNLASGKMLNKMDQADCQYCLNRTGDAVLLRSENGGVVWDMASGIQKGEFRLPRKEHSFGYCDQEGHAKCLTISKSIEIWNEESGVKAFVLGGEANKDRKAEVFQFSPDCRRVAIEEDGKILVWSLDNGQLLQTLPILGESLPVGLTDTALVWMASRVTFSNKSRWMTKIDEYTDPLFIRLSLSDYAIGRYLAACFQPKSLATLIDLDTGETCSSLPVLFDSGYAVAFCDDDSRMATFADDGKYEWAVPPRRRWFTPWTWLAFMGCLSLFEVWRRLRSPRHSRLGSASP